jgi:hypothetical protein
MQATTKKAIVFTGTVFLLFMIALRGNFFPEESVVLFIIPFVPVGTLLIVSLLVARMRKRRITVEKRVRRLLTSCSLFHCLLLAVYFYCTWPRAYERGEAIEDIDFFARTLEDVHPNLYDRVSRNEFADSVESLKRRLPDRVGEHPLFMDMSRLGALVRDAHTGNGWSYVLRRGNFLFRGMFPYKIRVENDRIYVTGNYSYRDDIPAGSEIVRINGLTSGEFIAQMSAWLSYETIPFRNSLLENPMSISIWNDFRPYQIEFRLPGGSGARRVETGGGIYARIRFIRSLSMIGEPYRFTVIEDSIGYIGFYACRDPERFKGFLRDSFGTMKEKGISRLIIDIRENGGGNSSLDDEFMQYISGTPFRIFEKATVKVSREILSAHRDWIDSARQVAGITYETPDIDLTSLRENPLRFTGSCVLLTGRGTFSSGAAFASAFRCFHAGFIVGEETGGITVCYGDLYTFTLPRTGFGFGVSWKKFVNACGVDDRRGVIPDYAVGSSVDDERTGRDAVLDFALDLARRKGAGRISTSAETQRVELVTDLHELQER